MAAAAAAAAGGGAQSSAPPAAYAKLQGENFVYYVRTLSVVLGRRVAGCDDQVDVDLGPSKTISRRHALIAYDFGSRRFVVSPLGKNGITVDGTFYEQGHPPVPLETKTYIQVGDVFFFFLLPIGQVSQSVQPMSKAPSLRLDPFYSRSPSPTETLS